LKKYRYVSWLWKTSLSAHGERWTHNSLLKKKKSCDQDWLEKRSRTQSNRKIKFRVPNFERSAPSNVRKQFESGQISGVKKRLHSHDGIKNSLLIQLSSLGLFFGFIRTESCSRTASLIELRRGVINPFAWFARNILETQRKKAKETLEKHFSSVCPRERNEFAEKIKNLNLLNSAKGNCNFLPQAKWTKFLTYRKKLHQELKNCNKSCQKLNWKLIDKE